MAWIRRKRVPYVPQLEMAECGVACLRMVLNYFGARGALSELRSLCQVSRDGCSALDLVRAARNFGLDTRALRVDVAQLAQLGCPAIVHWQFNHFVVLEHIASRSVTIVDPAVGRRRLTRSEFEEGFTGVVLSFAPGPDFKPGGRRDGTRLRFLRVLAECPPAVIQTVGLALLLQVVEIAVPAANQVLIDHVVHPKRDSWLPVVGGAFAAALACKTVLIALRQRVAVSIAQVMDLSLVHAFVQHLLHLPASFIEQRTVGDLMQRVESNTELRELAVSFVGACLDAVLVIGISLLALAYDARLGLLIVGLNAARVAAVVLLNRRVSQLSAAELALAGNERSTLVEGLNMPELVRAFNASEALADRFAGRLTQRLNAACDRRLLQARIGQCLSVFDTAASALVLWLSGEAVLEGRMTIGVLSAFFTLRALLAAPMGSLAAACAGFTQAGSILARIDDVMSVPRSPSGERVAHSLRGSLELSQVSFRHGPRSPWICKDLDLSIRPGEKLAIVGRTGSGKTSLARLMLGLVSPTMGEVRVDGVDIRRYDPASLRRHVAVVLQEPFFFDASVRENLCFGSAGASDGQLTAALEIACMAQDVFGLREGLDAPMGIAGSRFSRGQRQRLALARALVREPKVLVLDEATSSLDLETEAAVHANLARLSCTRIVVAHRLATVEDADRILVLEAGVIAAAGSYAELARRPGLFAEMVGNVA